MNAPLKAQVFKEIRNPLNKIKRNHNQYGEEFIVTSSSSRTLIEVLNGKDKHLVKVAGEEVEVSDEEFKEIMLELDICYEPETQKPDFQDKGVKLSVGIFSKIKEK